MIALHDPGILPSLLDEVKGFVGSLEKLREISLLVFHAHDAHAERDGHAYPVSRLLVDARGQFGEAPVYNALVDQPIREH